MSVPFSAPSELWQAQCLALHSVLRLSSSRQRNSAPVGVDTGLSLQAICGSAMVYEADIGDACLDEKCCPVTLASIQSIGTRCLLISHLAAQPSSVNVRISYVAAACIPLKSSSCSLQNSCVWLMLLMPIANLLYRKVRLMCTIPSVSQCCI